MNTRIVAAGTDATAPAGRDEALVRSEQRLREAQRAAGLGIHEWDIASGSVWCDARVRELWGVSADEPITYDTFMAGLHPDDRALTQAAVDKALDPSGDGRYCAEFRVISREDGIERWIAATGQTYCADSRPVRLVGTVQDITRRKQGEVELVRTGTLLETLLASAPLGFCYFDRELRYVRINDRLAAMNGIPAAEHIGRTVAEIVPSLAPIVQEVTGRILTTGQAVVGYEFFGETPLNPGVTRYWSENWYPVRDATGAISGFGVIVEEITDRRQAEEALRESEERLWLAWQATGDVIWDWSVQTDQQRWSAAGAEVFGWTDAINKPQTAAWWADRVHAEDRERVVARFHRAVDDPLQLQWQDEYRFLRRDGSVAHVFDRGFIIRGHDGKARRMIGAMQDITDRRRAAEALARERDLLQAIFNSAGEAHLVYIDRDFNFVRVNETYAASCGYRPEEMIGRNHFALYPHAENEAIFRRVRDTGELVKVRDKPFDFPDQPERGVTYWDWSLVPVKDATGQVTGLILSLFETTARVRAEEALSAANAALEHANAAKDAFIAKLSHELRTPLTPVVASLSAITRDPRLPDDLREDMVMLQRNIDLQVHLINDLLDVTRIVSGKLELRQRPVDVAGILHDVGRMLATDLEARGQRLLISAAGPVWVQADASRLHQVFWNLIKNSIKFSPCHSEVTVQTQADASRLRIAVSDQGRGIDPADMPRLFGAFEQGAASHGFGGLGLGLAICRGIIEAHGGSITAHSDGPGRGATFTLTLPLCPAPAGAAAAPAAGLSFPDEPRSLRILLVEDHADTARMMRRLLESEGHAVMWAGGVAAGMAAALTGEFDVLMSDLGLPDGTGCDLMRELIAVGKPLRGIAVSGHGTAADIRRSLEAGFVEHITKPVEFNALQRALLRVANGGIASAGQTDR